MLRTVAAACSLAHAGAPERFREHVVSAVGEAFNNIAVHGYDEGLTGSIDVSITVDAQVIAVELRDFGRSFDPRHAPPPDLAALPESGLGAYIMNRFMDEVSYLPGRPNVLTLKKRVT